MWNELLESRKRAGVAIADLTLTGEDDSELIVRFLSEGRDRDDAEDVLCTVGAAGRVQARSGSRTGS